MSSKYKFRIVYELRQDPNDDSKIRFITHGNTAKEVVENHGELMDEWRAFLEEEETEKSCEEEAYKTCEELEAMKNELN